MTSPRPPSAPALDLRGLLTIDVASELRKLCQAQLEGPWQLPAELVRRAIRTGASAARVVTGRHRVVVSDDGAGIHPAVLNWTALLADPQQDADQRHRALIALEEAGELALLAVVGLDRLRELRIETVHGQERHALWLRPGRSPALSTAPGHGAVGTEVTVIAPGLPRRRATEWLRDVARFAPVPVLVDGKRVADAFAGSLVHAPLVPPLRGRVALLPEGDTAHAYLLAHGLVTGHLTVPDVPPFEAALEVSAQGGELAAARLREAATPHIPALVDTAVLLIAAAAQRAWPERQRARLAELALEAARRGLQADSLERFPIFRAVSATGPSFLSLQSLRALAVTDGTGARSLPALGPEQDPARHALGDGPVLVADDAERSLLAEVLGVRFRVPSRRQSSQSLGSLLRRLLHDLRRAAGAGFDLLRHPLRPPALADAALTGEELALLTALRAELRATPASPVGQAILCAGEGPVRRTRDRPPVLVLPRHNPTVRACVRAFGADRGSLRMVRLALVGAIGGRASVARPSPHE